MNDTVSELVGRLTGSEPTALADPYPLYAKLRAAGRCLRAESGWGPPGWHLTHHADIGPALKDLRLSSRDVLPTPQPWETDELTRQFWAVVNGSLLTADPPDHTRLRKLVAPAFLPRRIQALRPQLQAVVDDLLLTVERKGEFDFIADFAAPLPLMAIALLMGVPKADWPLFRQLSEGLFDLQPSLQSMLNL